jgi:peroxiredoxin
MPDASTNADNRSSLVRSLGRLLRRYGVWGALLIGGVFLWQDMRPDVALPKSGPRAPDFTLTRLNGESFHLSEHRGEVVVLNVWATWCAPCRDEIPGFVQLQREFRDRGVQFVGLSVDESGMTAVRRFAQEQPLNYPQVASQRVAARKYGQTTAIPRTFVIDRRGRIRYTHSGLLLPGRLQPMLETLVAEPGPAG